MFIIIHYSGEIGSKGQNRRLFEKKLRDNVRSAFRKYDKISISASRLLIELPDGSDISRIEHIPGISYYGIAKKISQEEIPPDAAVRSSVAALKHLERNPKEPKGFVEILDQGIFHYPEKILGTGGLPVGTGGKLVVLLSGGIDSPVAAWKMMRRGCSVILVHFQNETQVTGSVEDKIHRLSKILSRHQFKTRLHVVKFGEIQRQIIAFSPAEIRMILYRRMMLRIAEKLMEKEGAKGLVTGDSLAQVASQTLDNLGIVYDAVSSPVLAPLIGDDKDAVISLAKRIGTFDTSILPYDDCCSFFVAKHPSTSTGIDEVRKVEGLLNMEQLIQHALRSTETKSFLMS